MLVHVVFTVEDLCIVILVTSSSKWHYISERWS